MIDSQSRRTSGSRASIPFLNGISSNDIHPQNKPSGNEVMLSGIVIFLSEEQPANVNGFNDVRLDGSFTSSRLSHEEKRFWPISVTESGKITFVTGASAKTPFPIFVTPWGTLITVPSFANSHLVKVFPSWEKINPSVDIILL